MNAGVLSRTLARAPAIAASAIVVVFSMVGVARAEDDAAKILKASTDYVAAQKSISATFDSDIEIITPDLQKIQFASFGADEAQSSRQAAYQANRRLRGCRADL